MIGASLYLLDTNIASYILNGRSPAARDTLTQTLRDSAVMISAITEGEILFGLEQRPEAVKLRASVLVLLATVQIHPWDRDAAQAYGRLRARLRTMGKNLAVMDLLIAAHALAAGATLVTHDRASQHLTPILPVVDWATDLS